MKDMNKDDALQVVVNEEGEAQFVKLDIKHRAEDFQNDANANQTIKREGFLKFLLQGRDVPKRAVFLAFAFVVIGAILFCLGFEKDLQAWDPFHGLLFWGAGLVLFTPGCYYVFKLTQAYFAKDVTARS